MSRGEASECGPAVAGPWVGRNRPRGDCRGKAERVRGGSKGKGKRADVEGKNLMTKHGCAYNFRGTSLRSSVLRVRVTSLLILAGKPYQAMTCISFSSSVQARWKSGVVVSFSRRFFTPKFPFPGALISVLKSETLKRSESWNEKKKKNKIDDLPSLKSTPPSWIFFLPVPSTSPRNIIKSTSMKFF